MEQVSVDKQKCSNNEVATKNEVGLATKIHLLRPKSEISYPPG